MTSPQSGYLPYARYLLSDDLAGYASDFAKLFEDKDLRGLFWKLSSDYADFAHAEMVLRPNIQQYGRGEANDTAVGLLIQAGFNSVNSGTLLDNAGVDRSITNVQGLNEFLKNRGEDEFRKLWYAVLEDYYTNTAYPGFIKACSSAIEGLNQELQTLGDSIAKQLAAEVAAQRQDPNGDWEYNITSALSDVS